LQLDWLSRSISSYCIQQNQPQKIISSAEKERRRNRPSNNLSMTESRSISVAESAMFISYYPLFPFYAIQQFKGPIPTDKMNVFPSRTSTLATVPCSFFNQQRSLTTTLPSPTPNQCGEGRAHKRFWTDEICDLSLRRRLRRRRWLDSGRNVEERGGRGRSRRRWAVQISNSSHNLS
jgi:hypothetical protein